MFPTSHTSYSNNYLKYQTNSESRKWICFRNLRVPILRLWFLFEDLRSQYVQFNQIIETSANTGHNFATSHTPCSNNYLKYITESKLSKWICFGKLKIYISRL